MNMWTLHTDQSQSTTGNEWNTELQNPILLKNLHPVFCRNWCTNNNFRM